MDSQTPLVQTDRLLHNVNGTSHYGDNSLFSGDTGFTPSHALFWIVNGIVVVVVVSFMIWCCGFGGGEAFVKWVDGLINRQSNSDVEYARRVLERQQQLEKERMETPEKRKATLLKSFERGNLTMVVEEKHLITETDADIETGVTYDPSMDTGDGFLSYTADDAAAPRVVPNCCAVCLTPYEVGETVIWSVNCPHAFHQECVLDWFVKMQDGTPCPCCRQEFTDLKRQEEKKKIARRTPAQTQFNVSVISLR